MCPDLKTWKLEATIETFRKKENTYDVKSRKTITAVTVWLSV